jgi:translocation and assembly module TamA
MAAALLPLPALAKIEIEIPNVSEAIQTNVRAFLSLTRYADRDDVTDEVMSRLQRRIVSETRQALEPLGYYEPEVAYDVQKQGELWKVAIRIEPGRCDCPKSASTRPGPAQKTARFANCSKPKK